MSSNTRTLLLLALLMLVLVAFPVQAAPTVEQVRQATQAGVAWLAAHQNPDGSWGAGEQDAITGLVLLKLEHHAVDPKWGLGLPSPFDDRNPYKSNIEQGLAWLLPRARTVAIGAQPAGNPDTNGNGAAAAFGFAHHENYSTAAVLMAVCQAVEMNRLVVGGPLADMTYKAAAEEMMNFFAWGQADSGSVARGGWQYSGNDQSGDNSNAGYVTLALAYAEAKPPVGCGLLLPAFVKSELNFWITYIQGGDGGSGYMAPDSWENTLKTGNLLQQMALFGDDSNSPRVQAALGYLANHWNDPNLDPGWRGPYPVNYQATFTIMKGLNALSIARFGTPEIDWQADFDTALLAEQNPDGSWPSTAWDYSGDRILSTTWALLTLQRAAPVATMAVAVDVKPTSCPNPFNVKAKGVLPVAVVGLQDFDVRQIDPTSVKLEGVPPLRWAYEDVATPYRPFLEKQGPMACTPAGRDGLLDLTLHFDHPAVAAALNPPPAADREVRTLKLTGSLKAEFGAKPIAGEDVAIILMKP